MLQQQILLYLLFYGGPEVQITTAKQKTQFLNWKDMVCMFSKHECHRFKVRTSPISDDSCRPRVPTFSCLINIVVFSVLLLCFLICCCVVLWATIIVRWQQVNRGSGVCWVWTTPVCDASPLSGGFGSRRLPSSGSSVFSVQFLILSKKLY